jgi:ABC-2 type transport system permease protein
MKIFDKIKKKTPSEKRPKLRNKGAWKQGGYAVAITAVIIAVAVAVNFLFAVLAERVNLDIDVSLTGANTLSEENIDYIKSLDKKVTVTVCFKQEDFVSGTEYVAQNKYLATDNTGSGVSGSSYYKQSLSLLDRYDVYSENITVKFVDPYDPSFSEITKKYTNVQMGDIIVECAKTVEGKEAVRSEILSFDDIYYLTEDDTYSSYLGYSSYIVSGNNLETALTSAIYKVTSDNTQKALVLEHHCKTGNLTEYIAYLKQNNFDVEMFSESVLNEIDPDVDMVIIAEPKEDFATEELNVIDEWLYNGGQRGKGLMYLASPSSPDMPNLFAYLEEWGVAFEEGTLYETEKNYQVFGEATTNFFVPAEISGEDDVTKQFVDIMNNSEAIAGGNVPLLQVFEQEGLRLTTPIAVTPGETVVVAPLDATSGWTPDGSYEKNQHIGILMSTEADYVENQLCVSYVAVFSSRDFVDSYWFTSYDVNSDVIINTAKVISGAEDDGKTFTMRKMSNDTFSDVVTSEAISVMSVIFQWMLPLMLIAIGIVVFVRRSRR